MNRQHFNSEKSSLKVHIQINDYIKYFGMVINTSREQMAEFHVQLPNMFTPYLGIESKKKFNSILELQKKKKNTHSRKKKRPKQKQTKNKHSFAFAKSIHWTEFR